MLIIYRSYGGENMKGRPDYYSKTLCLLSVLRAAEAEPGVKLIFMNDGPMPQDRLRLMEQSGEVLTLDSVGMRKSYIAGLRLGWSNPQLGDDELVYFSEDDYLYQPNAVTALVAAEKELPGQYLALYGPTTGHPVNFDDPDGQWTPPRWQEIGPIEVAGTQWSRGVSTASTFGARRKALYKDRSVFIQGLLPHRHRYRDHDTCVVYQGYEPHKWSDIGRELLMRDGGSDLKERLRVASIAPFKAALNVRSHRLRQHRHVLLTAVPNLATHVEIGWMTPGVDWSEVAAETNTWAAERGLLTEHVD